MFLDEMVLEEAGLGRFWIRAGLTSCCTLETYFTVRPKGPVPGRSKAGLLCAQSCGWDSTVISEKGFIRAETIAYDDFGRPLVRRPRQRGRQECAPKAKSYTVKDGGRVCTSFSTPESKPAGPVTNGRRFPAKRCWHRPDRTICADRRPARALTWAHALRAPTSIDSPRNPAITTLLFSQITAFVAPWVFFEYASTGRGEWSEGAPPPA